MGIGNYVLDGHTPRREDDLQAWARWFETADRRVALTPTPDGEVSTVFLGMDHRWGASGPPLVFETMVFGGDHDGECERYSTWEQAERGHAKIVGMISGDRA